MPAKKDPIVADDSASVKVMQSIRSKIAPTTIYNGKYRIFFAEQLVIFERNNWQLNDETRSVLQIIQQRLCQFMEQMSRASSILQFPSPSQKAFWSMATPQYEKVRGKDSRAMEREYPVLDTCGFYIPNLISITVRVLYELYCIIEKWVGSAESFQSVIQENSSFFTGIIMLEEINTESSKLLQAVMQVISPQMLADLKAAKALSEEVLDDTVTRIILNSEGGLFNSVGGIDTVLDFIVRGTDFISKLQTMREDSPHWINVAGRIDELLTLFTAPSDAVTSGPLIDVSDAEIAKILQLLQSYKESVQCGFIQRLIGQEKLQEYVEKFKLLQLFLALRQERDVVTGSIWRKAEAMHPNAILGLDLDRTRKQFISYLQLHERNRVAYNELSEQFKALAIDRYNASLDQFILTQRSFTRLNLYIADLESKSLVASTHKSSRRLARGKTPREVNATEELPCDSGRDGIVSIDVIDGSLSLGPDDLLSLNIPLILQKLQQEPLCGLLPAEIIRKYVTKFEDLRVRLLQPNGVISEAGLFSIIGGLGRELLIMMQINFSLLGIFGDIFVSPQIIEKISACYYHLTSRTVVERIDEFNKLVDEAINFKETLRQQVLGGIDHYQRKMLSFSTLNPGIVSDLLDSWKSHALIQEMEQHLLKVHRFLQAQPLILKSLIGVTINVDDELIALDGLHREFGGLLREYRLFINAKGVNLLLRSLLQEPTRHIHLANLLLAVQGTSEQDLQLRTLVQKYLSHYMLHLAEHDLAEFLWQLTNSCPLCTGSGKTEKMAQITLDANMFLYNCIPDDKKLVVIQKLLQVDSSSESGELADKNVWLRTPQSFAVVCFRQHMLQGFASSRMPTRSGQSIFEEYVSSIINGLAVKLQQIGVVVQLQPPGMDGQPSRYVFSQSQVDLLFADDIQVQAAQIVYQHLLQYLRLIFSNSVIRDYCTFITEGWIVRGMDKQPSLQAMRVIFNRLNYYFVDLATLFQQSSDVSQTIKSSLAMLFAKIVTSFTLLDVRAKSFMPKALQDIFRDMDLIKKVLIEVRVDFLTAVASDMVVPDGHDDTSLVGTSTSSDRSLESQSSRTASTVGAVTGSSGSSFSSVSSSSPLLSGFPSRVVGGRESSSSFVIPLSPPCYNAPEPPMTP